MWYMMTLDEKDSETMSLHVYFNVQYTWFFLASKIDTDHHHHITDNAYVWYGDSR
jgi:hypothetical protein